LRKIKVNSNEEIIPGIFILKFKRPFTFIPGQVIGITTSEQITARLYSIASGKDDPDISILYNRVEDGKLTPDLSRLRKGETLLVSDPFGSFTDTRIPSWWIATGTGVAPFISMIRSGITEQKTLVQGARTRESFYFSGELEKSLENHYIRCCSGENLTGYFPGRVTDFLVAENNLPTDNMYYLCGSAEMVVSTRDILISRNIPFSNIVSEIYF